MAKKKSNTDNGNKPTNKPGFDPAKPYAIGARGGSSFYIQDGRMFDRQTLACLGTIDG